MPDILKRVIHMDSPSVQTPLYPLTPTNDRSRFIVLAELQSQLQDLREESNHVHRDYDNRITSHVPHDAREEYIIQLEDKLSVRTRAMNLFDG